MKKCHVRWKPRIGHQHAFVRRARPEFPSASHVHERSPARENWNEQVAATTAAALALCRHEIQTCMAEGVLLSAGTVGLKLPQLRTLRVWRASLVAMAVATMPEASGVVLRSTLVHLTSSCIESLLSQKRQHRDLQDLQIVAELVSAQLACTVSYQQMQHPFLSAAVLEPNLFCKNFSMAG